jgi:hypothetical protein
MSCNHSKILFFKVFMIIFVKKFIITYTFKKIGPGIYIYDYIRNQGQNIMYTFKTMVYRWEPLI